MLQYPLGHFSARCRAPGLTLERPGGHVGRLELVGLLGPHEVGDVDRSADADRDGDRVA